MVLINMARKCLWARHVQRFICKIIQSLPTNDGGVKNDVCLPRLPNMHQGPTDAEDWRPHLSLRCSNCIVGSLLSSAQFPLFPIHRRSAAQTILVLMKPSDEVAITDFCHCHRGQQGRRWRGRGGGVGYLPPEGFSTPAVLRWMAGWLSCCQRQLESTSWIRGLLYEWLLGVKWCITAYGDVCGLMDDLLTLPRTLKNGEVLPCAVRKLDSFDIFWVIPFKYFSPVELAQILHIKNQFAWHHQDFPPSSNDLLYVFCGCGRAC